ncbi:MAG: ABC transporter permease [Flavobacteriales bacterium]|nr:ABC transporter permease [Flavobacteriales bacterium]
MSKIGLIIQREYLTRVRKKSFVIMTILGPVLMAAMFIVPIWIALNEDEDTTILVIDESHLFSDLPPLHMKLEDTENIHFKLPEASLRLDSAKSELLGSDDFDAVLYIHPLILNTTNGVKLIYEKQPSLQVIRYIENSLENSLSQIKLSGLGVNMETIERVKKEAHVSLATLKIDEIGEKNQSRERSMAIGMFSGILIYMFIFLYGVQVMRGVIEEKTNRIIEVIISSVKPFELMMGKIIGIALVGLTQFVLWVALSTAFYSGTVVFVERQLMEENSGVNLEEVLSRNQTLTPNVATDESSAELNVNAAKEFLSKVDGIPFAYLIGCFVFYFLGGYLIYSALFAAVGSAVDNEADTQQFMLPITIPIIFSFLMSQVVINNPDGTLAMWLSMIPFTSPIIMMVRIPFGGVPLGELALSMSLLVIGFVATTWLAGRIYRTGILMYGKKISYKELWKWIRYH